MEWRNVAKIRLLADFDGSFFNDREEFIAHRYSNTYFIFSNCESSQEAFEKYAQKKEETIKRIADEYIDIIPKKAYDAIYRYKVEMKNDKNMAV